MVWSWLTQGRRNATQEQDTTSAAADKRRPAATEPAAQVAPQHPQTPASLGGKATRLGFAQQLAEAAGQGALLDPTRVATWAVGKGIFSDAANLRLGDLVTRAEAAVMASRAFGLPQLGAGEVKRVFKDLSATHWAAPQVYGAATVGVISGFGDETFKPDESIEHAHSAGLARLGAAPPGAPKAFDPRVEWGSRPNLKGGKLGGTNRANSLDADGFTTRDATATKDKRVEATQAIVDELDAGGSKRYQPGGNLTYCNIFAHDYAHLMGAFVPRMWWNEAAMATFEKTGQFPEPVYGKNTYEMNANALHDWFHEHGHRFGWSKLGDVDPATLTSAQAIANEGRVVIVVGDTASSRSGHITAVIPEGGDKVQAVRNKDGQVTKAWQSQAGSKPTTRGASGWYDSAKYKGGKDVWVHG